MRPVGKWAAWSLLLLSAFVGGYVAVHWAPDRSVEALTERWATPPSEFVEISGMQVHLRDEGPRDDPTPLVLLHGTSSSLHTWDGWVARLKDRRRVIRVDLPGFGLTGPFADDDYHVAHYLSFMAALLERLALGRVVLVGNSFGGQIAWETALAYPDRVEKLVLVDAAGYPLQAISVPIGFRLAQMPLLAPLLSRVLPRRIVASSLANVYGDPSKVTPELIDRHYELALRAGNRQALRLRFLHAPAGADAARIPAIRTPTLILWGALDETIPATLAQRFHDEIPGSELVIFPGLGHVPQEEDAPQTVAALERFLIRTASSAPALQ